VLFSVMSRSIRSNLDLQSMSISDLQLQPSTSSMKREMATSSDLIYKDECLSVCLFFMHLNTVCASAAKLSRNPPFTEEKVVGYFPPEMISPPHPPTNGIAVFLGISEDQPSQVFEGGESEFGLRLGEIRFADLEPIGIHFLRNP
jgi:hypothetical protein